MEISAANNGCIHFPGDFHEVRVQLTEALCAQSPWTA